MNSVTFKFWVTLECARRHGNCKPKRFDFCIEHKSIDLLEEIGIKSSVAFLKFFSILAAS